MDLSWKVTEIRYGCSNSDEWVTIPEEEKSGSGDATPTVKIKAATGPDDCPSATIFISASTGQIQSVPVTRCIPECSCKSLDFKALSVAEQEADGSPSVQIGTYNNPCVCDKYAHVDVDGVVLCNPTSGGGNIYATVNPNEDEQARSGWFRFRYNGNICVDTTYVAQKAKESKCGLDTDCDVDPWYHPTTEIGHSGGNIVAEGGDVYVWVSKCWDVNGIDFDTSIITDITPAPDKDEEEYAAYLIEVKSNDGNQRSFTADFDLTNTDTGEICDGQHIVEMVQDGGEVPPTPSTCECRSIGFTFNNITYEAVGSSGKRIGIINLGTCADKYEFVKLSNKKYNGSDAGDKIYHNNGEIFIRDIPQNDGTDNKTYSYTIEYKVDGTPCSKNAEGYQGVAGACYYTLGDTFSITCDTSTNKQMLSYSVTNENGCSSTSSDQNFTIKLGNGNTYDDISGKPGDNGKREVEISDSTTTVEWHNAGNESVSGKVSSVNVEQCQSKKALNFTFNMQTSDQSQTGYYFSSFQISFGIKDSSGTITNINSTDHSLRFDEECSKTNALWINNTEGVSSDIWKSAYETKDIKDIVLTGAKFVISVVNRGVLKKNGETKPGTYSCDTSYGGQLNTSNCRVYGLGSPLSPTSSSGLPVFEYPINSESDINGKTITLELAPKTN